jgi:hypothetical protein
MLVQLLVCSVVQHLAAYLSCAAARPMRPAFGIAAKHNLYIHARFHYEPHTDHQN